MTSTKMRELAHSTIEVSSGEGTLKQAIKRIRQSNALCCAAAFRGALE